MKLSLGDAIDRLITVSNRIFHNEMEIGKIKNAGGQVNLERVGKLALEIRELNAERVALRNHISAYDPGSFRDVKVAHASEARS